MSSPSSPLVDTIILGPNSSPLLPPTSSSSDSLSLEFGNSLCHACCLCGISILEDEGTDRYHCTDCEFSAGDFCVPCAQKSSFAHQHEKCFLSLENEGSQSMRIKVMGDNVAASLNNSLKIYKNRMLIGNPKRRNPKDHNDDDTKDQKNSYDHYDWLSYQYIHHHSLMLSCFIGQHLSSAFPHPASPPLLLCSLYLPDTYHWVICEFACVFNGIITVGIHSEWALKNVQKVFEETRSTIIFVDKDNLHKFIQIVNGDWGHNNIVKDIQMIICITPRAEVESHISSSLLLPLSSSLFYLDEIFLHHSHFPSLRECKTMTKYGENDGKLFPTVKLKASVLEMEEKEGDSSPSSTTTASDISSSTPSPSPCPSPSLPFTPPPKCVNCHENFSTPQSLYLINNNNISPPSSLLSSSSSSSSPLRWSYRVKGPSTLCNSCYLRCDNPLISSHRTKVIEKAEKIYDTSMRDKYNNIFTIIYSSGSNNIPKGCCLSHFTWQESTFNVKNMIISPLVTMSMGSLSHSSGRMIIYQFMANGGRVAFLPLESSSDTHFPSPSPVVDLLMWIGVAKPMLLVAMPSVWNQIHLYSKNNFSLLPSPLPAIFSTLKLIGTGGSPISPSTLSFLNTLCDNVINAYGLTECGGISNNGVILSGVEVKIMRREGKGEAVVWRELSEGEEGEILVKNGMGMISGYLQLVERNGFNDKIHFSPLSITPHGYYITGDMGTLSRHSPSPSSPPLLHISGRKDNLIELYYQGESVWFSGDQIEGKYLDRVNTYCKECKDGNGKEEQEDIYGDENSENERKYLEDESDIAKKIMGNFQCDYLILYGERSEQQLISLIHWKTQQINGNPIRSAEMENIKNNILKEIIEQGKRDNIFPYQIPSGAILIFDDWNVSNGMLTITGKVRRRNVIERYRDEIQKEIAFRMNQNVAK